MLMKMCVAALKKHEIFNGRANVHSFVRIYEAFKNEFPDSGEPSNSTISWLFQKFLNTGSVLDHLRVHVCTTRTTNNCNCISDSIDDASCLSIRRCEQSLNLSQITIQHSLKEIKL